MIHQRDCSLIIQSDLSILLDERKPGANEARELLILVAEAEKRTGRMHTYRISPMSLWNGLSTGIAWPEIHEALLSHARYGIPAQAEASLRTWADRLGKLTLSAVNGRLLLSGDEEMIEELRRRPGLSSWFTGSLSASEWELDPNCRGLFKQELTRLGYPVIDRAGYHEGQTLDVRLKERTGFGQPFAPRAYQQAAVNRFLEENSMHGGSGVVVLPCGTGKTIVGLAALARLSAETLILTSSVISARQWKDELLDKTTLAEHEVGLYAGSGKEVRPVTIATYQLLTRRRQKDGEFTHMKLFWDRDWGLILYDEVHMLPAPVFRMTASIQATRRLGLTATLIREDGCAEDVYSLIGPKLFDLQWKQAESESYISEVACTEIRVGLHPLCEEEYAAASPRAQLRIAAENPSKLAVVKQLLQKHRGKPTLIIGQYLKQLGETAEALQAPLLTGNTLHSERMALYERFRSGEIGILVVSKVANIAVDLPDAAVAIQLSGSFGSRQEEAQRIGRLLRPKKGGNHAWFYSLVTNHTKEALFAAKRQLFMLEQGYSYEQLNAAEQQEQQDRQPGSRVPLTEASQI
ncbi:DNA repair helicase XPB [Paenibacillus sp. HB172176]|uniref:DNA repair helicase XPB n=1 Tax=Paenibacillus sp. HB172176 TaxID=2493690 RepID=UPI00143B7954|nr:DNA repair helicase XPB [Paenibacillus sp. HB172176]